MDDQRIVRIEDKIDSVKDILSSVNVTLASQHESLKEHMRRTELLEKQIAPIQRDLDTRKSLMRILGGFFVLIGVAAGIAEILEFFKK